jgi:Bacterial sugar transferase.
MDRKLLWKRIFDVLFSMGVIIGLSPLFLIISVIIFFQHQSLPHIFS